MKAASSASAAKTSETNAAISEANALRYSQEAGAKANTDKTLSIADAPADAKATGDRINAIKIETDKTLTISAAAADAAAVGVRIKLLEMTLGTPVEGVAFMTAFDTLEGVALEGVWNKAMSRVEF